MSSIFWNFVCHPRQTGACFASSPALCREITSHIHLENASAVAELGPGTGAITVEIRRKLPEGALFTAVELNEKFADEISVKFPEIRLFRGCASKLDQMLKEKNMPLLDAVISGLPFAIFPAELQQAILSSVVRSLKPGGVFTTFAYVQGLILPAGIRFRQKLDEHFSCVETSSVVWRNLPPAIVYRCRNKEDL